MISESRLTELSDKELENLHSNAVRLAQSGKPAQQSDAEKLLPMIGVEIERRSTARAAEAAAKRAAKRKPAAPRKASKAALAAANGQAQSD